MPDVYSFGPPKDEVETYTDGTIVPHRYQEIRRQTTILAEWEVVGYVEIHLHRVKRDSTDIEDISVGTTTRINPKAPA